LWTWLAGICERGPRQNRSRLERQPARSTATGTPRSDSRDAWEVGHAGEAWDPKDFEPIRRALAPQVQVRWYAPVLPFLFGGPDKDLVDGDLAGPGDNVGDGIGDRVRWHGLTELIADALEDLRTIMAGQLGGGRPWLDH
jgi:hypothetical protein